MQSLYTVKCIAQLLAPIGIKTNHQVHACIRKVEYPNFSLHQIIHTLFSVSQYIITIFMECYKHDRATVHDG